MHVCALTEMHPELSDSHSVVCDFSDRKHTMNCWQFSWVKLMQMKQVQKSDTCFLDKLCGSSISGKKLKNKTKKQTQLPSESGHCFDINTWSPCMFIAHVVFSKLICQTSVFSQTKISSA
jgi:hypothetical protein